MEFTAIFLRIYFLELFYAAPILLWMVMMIVLIGYSIGRIEGWSNLDAMYHAFINATTVGYGDFRPTKKPSKILAIVNALVGLVLTGVLVAIGLHAVEYAFGSVYDQIDLIERAKH